MLRGLLFRLVIIFLIGWVGDARSDPRVQQGPPPTWVREFPGTELTAAGPKDADSYIVLWDRQIDVEKGESYVRTIKKICTAAGVQTSSQLSTSFDPEYENVVFHRVIVRRDGVEINRLNLGKIKILQQESDLDRYQYNGRLTALLVLDDIRAGDAVEYCYTVRGRNPILKNHVADILLLDWTTPVLRERVVLNTPSNHPIRSRILKKPTALPQQSRSGGQTTYTWDFHDLKPIELESHMASWFMPFSTLELSDFNDWQDVIAWGRPLFENHGPVDEAIAKKVKELTAGMTDNAEKAVVILDFVQNEIRYLGIELGQGSYLPSAPAVVFERRYGDCKDKVRLLCQMMRDAGIEATPAFTHSTRKEAIEQRLPSPFVFDHVIARVEINLRYFWVDPTLSDQAGSLEVRSLPDYRLALPLDENQTGLARIPVDDRMTNHIDVAEQFFVDSVTTPARLEVRTSYGGLFADAMRAYLRSTPIQQVSKTFTNRRMKLYRALTADNPIQWKNESLSNRVIVYQSFKIPELFTKAPGDPLLRAEFSPSALEEDFYAPEALLRTSPHALPFPLKVTIHTAVQLPSHWPLNKKDLTVNDKGFYAKSTSESVGKQMTFDYTYETKSDSVAPDRMVEYANHLAEFRTEMGASLTYNTEIAEQNKKFRLNKTYVFSGIGMLLVFGCLACFVYTRNWGLHQVPAIIDSRLNGLSGWLVIVMIGVCLRPAADIWVARAIVPFFDLRRWSLLTSEAQTLFLILLFLRILGMVVALLTAVTFFRRRRLFPLLFILNIAHDLVFVTFNTYVRTEVSADHKDFAFELGRALGALLLPSVVWGLYMFVSRRVKSTFTLNYGTTESDATDSESSAYPKTKDGHRARTSILE